MDSENCKNCSTPAKCAQLQKCRRELVPPTPGSSGDPREVVVPWKNIDSDSLVANMKRDLLEKAPFPPGTKDDDEWRAERQRNLLVVWLFDQVQELRAEVFALRAARRNQPTDYSERIG